jgi:two-component system sensor histidine kinase ChiS
MKINYKLARTIIFCLVLIILIGFEVFENKEMQYQKSPKAVQGIIDLNEWDQNDMSHFKLDGEWEFYWNRLLEPNDFSTGAIPEKTGYLKMPFEWKNTMVGDTEIEAHGYATYRLIVKNVEPNMLYALNIPYIPISYKMWSNGVLVAQNGKVAENKSESMPSTEPKVTTVYSRTNQLVFILQVSNYFKRQSTSRSIEFGLHDSVFKERSLSLMMDIRIRIPKG